MTLSSFLIVLILLVTCSINSFASAQTNETITDKLIQGICHQTRNPPLCLNKLKSLKGKSLRYNPVATLGNSSMNEAHSRASRTRDLIWAQYRGTSVHKPEVRIKYHTCFLKYSIVMDQLKDAMRYMRAGDPKYVKIYITNAVGRVHSCDEDLMKPHRQQSPVLEANANFKDLCSIILSICNKLERWNHVN